jgi:ribonuclease P protein component
MPGKQRIRNSRDFHRVRTTGASARSDGLTVWMAPRGQEGSVRLGLSVRTRRAVDRNRIRRRVRQAWTRIDVRPGRDVVVGADPSTMDVEYQELVTHLQSAVSRAEASL